MCKLLKKKKEEKAVADRKGIICVFYKAGLRNYKPVEAKNLSKSKNAKILDLGKFERKDLAYLLVLG